MLSLVTLTSVLLYWASINTSVRDTWVSWTSFVNDPTRIPSHCLRRTEKLMLKVADLWNYSKKTIGFLFFFCHLLFFWGQDLNLNLIRSYRRSYSHCYPLAKENIHYNMSESFPSILLPTFRLSPLSFSEPSTSYTSLMHYSLDRWMP